MLRGGGQKKISRYARYACTLPPPRTECLLTRLAVSLFYSFNTFYLYNKQVNVLCCYNYNFNNLYFYIYTSGIGDMVS